MKICESTDELKSNNVWPKHIFSPFFEGLTKRELYYKIFNLNLICSYDMDITNSAAEMGLIKPMHRSKA